jgi:hypothetical protein
LLAKDGLLGFLVRLPNGRTIMIVVPEIEVMEEAIPKLEFAL